MNGKLFLLDTNTILYILGNRIDFKDLPEGIFITSIISEIELLSYPKLSVHEESLIKKFLNNIDIIDLTSKIKSNTIALRKKYSLKLPDAVICATSFSFDAILLTNDKKLSKVNEIELKCVKVL